MKKKSLILSFLMLAHGNLIPADDTDGTVVLRSPRYDLAFLSVFSAGFAGMCIWVAKKAIENIRIKGKKWGDPFDGKNGKDTNGGMIISGIAMTLVCIPCSAILGHMWVTNFLKRHIPFVIFNEKGFTYKNSQYTWHNVKKMKYEPYRDGNNIKCKLVFTMDHGSDISMKMEDIGIKEEKLTELITSYTKLYDAIEEGIHFPIKNTSQLKHLEDKVKNRQIIYWYDVLNVAANVPINEIKKAWLKKSLLLHPDKNNGKETEEYRLLNNAYQYAQALHKEETKTEENDFVNGDID